MIYYNFITIILFFIIFVLILKFKDFRFENFSVTDCVNNQNDRLDCNILRIMSDRRVNNHILNLLKQSNNQEDRERIGTQNVLLDEFIQNAEDNQENVDKILLKLRKIDIETNNKLKTYTEEKNKSDNYLIELTDHLQQPNESSSYILSNDDFEEKNNLIKNKLLEYYNIAKRINHTPNNISDKILILKNFGNNKELNLYDVDKELKMYNEYKNLKSKIYQLYVNDSCVNFIDKYNYKVENCISDNNNFLFIVNKIENYNIYNKFISYSKTARDFHEVDSNDTTISYPFYIISPMKNYSVCLTYTDNKISFQQIRNNPNQRFKKVLNSNYCIY